MIFISLFLILTQCSIPDPSDVTPPTVLTVFPYEGAVVSANVEVVISAMDNQEVSKVWYYLDGEKMAETTKSPYKLLLDITNVEKNISHTIQSAAIDGNENTGYAPIVNFVVSTNADIIPPTVTILNPHSGQVVEDDVLVTADAEDDRSIQKVAFFIDADSIHVTSEYPYIYEWDTSIYPDSTQHTIFAKAFDGGNNSTVSDPVIVTVYKQNDITRDETPPTVVFLYPVAGSDVSGTITVSVDLLDNIGVINAEFYVDGQLKESVNLPTTPWNFNWNTAGLSSGSHTLYVKAYDLIGNIGTSGLMTVNIP